jgi:hypothetical protein
MSKFNNIKEEYLQLFEKAMKVFFPFQLLVKGQIFFIQFNYNTT